MSVFVLLQNQTPISAYRSEMEAAEKIFHLPGFLEDECLLVRLPLNADLTLNPDGLILAETPHAERSEARGVSLPCSI